jgi:uncharacterized membrane protein
MKGAVNSMDGSNPNKTPLGLSQNVEALLCYVLAWVTGIVFLLLEKENKFVKFHAIQSIITFLPLSILSWILGGFLSTLIAILTFILWILLMYKASLVYHLNNVN